MSSTSEASLEKRFDGEPALAWRARQLLRAGFTVDQAGWLAECRSVDLHYAIELLERGLAHGSTREVIFDVLAE
jgi:hypothetical protein